MAYKIKGLIQNESEKTKQKNENKSTLLQKMMVI